LRKKGGRDNTPAQGEETKLSISFSQIEEKEIDPGSYHCGREGKEGKKKETGIFPLAEREKKEINIDWRGTCCSFFCGTGKNHELAGLPYSAS